MNDFAGLSALKPSRTIQLGNATRRNSPLSTSSPASRATTSGESGMGSGAVVSTDVWLD